MDRLLDDPYLAPYRAAIRNRAARARERAAALTNDSLADWAQGHRYFGLQRDRRGWTFREWAPNASAIYLVGDFNGWQRRPEWALKPIGGGVWEGRFRPEAIRHAQYYHLVVVWSGGEGERLPAYATRVVQDADTLLFSAQVWRPARTYRWRHASPPAPKTALIYEAHVGMATEEEKVGSYGEFRDTMLGRIKAAGYNTVQLMAVMEHPYYGSFGYHVSSFFAASSRFGTPEELKSLIDTAHGLGLRVIMDIVHSHAVANERDGLSRFDGTEYQYFHAGERGRHPAWGSRCFDYGKDEVVHFLLSNCRYWLEEYHFDGFRFDGVTSMLYRHHGLGTAFTDYSMYFDGSVDDDAWTYLALANRLIHEFRPGAVTIAEDVSGLPGCAAPLRDGGLGFDCRLAMGEPDFWFHLADKLRDEDWPMGGMYHTLTDHRREERTVSYVESHDQALVGGKTFFFQLVDSAIYTGMGVRDESAVIDRGLALHKLVRLATYALNGGAYLNFMGNEFGHPEWIDFPRSENGWSYAHARRQWSLAADENLKFRFLAEFDREMLRSPAAGRSLLLEADEQRKVLAFIRGERLFVFNFHPVNSYPGYGVLVPPATHWRHHFDSDEPRFGGQGRIAPHQTYSPVLVRARGELVQQILLYLPARTAIVLAISNFDVTPSEPNGYLARGKRKVWAWG